MGPVLLALSGIAFAGAGIFPIDMDRQDTVVSIAHMTSSLLSGVLWVAALFWLGPLFRRTPRWGRWGRLTPWFALFVVANIGWQVLFQTTGLVMPGWGQRLAFGGFFLWIVMAAWVLWRTPRPIPA